MAFSHPSKGQLPEEIKLSLPPNIVSSRDVDRFCGSIIGLAVGDALGASVEFRPHQYFLSNPVREMQGGGTWGLRSGQWTDDTSMALCLASSLITRKGYDPYNQMVQYKWWYKQGYMSSTGQCFDIGNATKDSIEQFIRRQNSLKKSLDCTEDELDQLSLDDIQSITKFNIDFSGPGVAGNGALMRLAPVPLFFYRYPELAVEYAGLSGRLTHGDDKAYDACRYYGALIVAALQGKKKEQLIDVEFYSKHKPWFGGKELHPEILRIAKGSYQNPKGYEGGIRGKGYIVNALEAALWAFWSDGNSFEKGALAAVNLGDDTDTTAAIYGQLAGAYYGYNGIPSKWRKIIYAHNLLERVGQWLYYEGEKYRPTEKEETIICSGQNAAKTSFNEYQSVQTNPLVTDTRNTNRSHINPQGSRELIRDQFDSRKTPVYYAGVGSTQMRYPSEKQVSKKYPDQFDIRSNISDTNQSTTYQRAREQRTGYFLDSYPTSTQQLNQPTNAQRSTRRDYTAGYTEHDIPVHDNTAGHRNSRTNQDAFNPRYRNVPIDISSSSRYQNEVVSEDRRRQTSSNNPRFSSSGQRYDTEQTRMLPLGYRYSNVH